ncbi:MAG: hypothetical protein NT091_05325, partial [Candidatus Falkowbacteria bacterium]|nr:hypothetical protein [Candidatus Falkowbacteria bacterium]
KIQTILDTINMGLTRASEGTAKLAENGIEVSAEDKAALEKAQALYQEAKNLFDEEKFSEVPTKLTAIKALNLEEHFSAYKEKAFPKNRLADIQTQMHNGVKALELTIIHSKEYGMDVTPMEEILTKLKSLVEKADAALIANSTEAFLTYADQAGKLRTGEKVDASIRKVADGRADSMIKDGLDKFNSIVPEFQKIISDLEAKKVNVNRAKAILNDLIKSIASAQNDYDKKEFMIAGRNINDAASNVISLKNILTDSGQKLSSDTQNGINAIITDSKDGADLSNINPDSAKKAQSMLSAISSDNAYKVKSGLMNFDPELLNRVIASREKDKKLIDSVMNDVMPLLSADEQAKFMDGKIGLIEESQSADNTIAQVKKIKGMAGDAIKTFEDIKNQIKAYNFDSSVATTLEEKIANFNDQIQSGELKDPTEIKNYISILKDSVKKAIDTSVNEKFKDGVIPAKNIDDTNPSFGNIEYLVKDGALSPDKNGNIDLKAKVDGKKIADMVNKTVDRKNAVSSNDKQIDMKDAIMITISAYFPNIPTNPKDFKDAESYAKKMGLNIQAADLSKPADMGAIAQIISKADQRWGDEKLK